MSAPGTWAHLVEPAPAWGDCPPLVDLPNPWGLSPCELRALRAVLVYGSQKAAARALGVSHRTVDAHVVKGKRRMGGNDKLRHFIVLDRWLRQQEQQAPLEQACRSESTPQS